MSINGNISMLGSAMRAFQYGLDVTANNTANAATVGYSRQILTLDPLAPLSDGSGLQLGSGVQATSVQRVRDMFLDSSIKLQLSELGSSSVSQVALSELAAIFPEVANSAATTGLQGAISNMATAWNNLALAPASIAAKTAVRDAAKAVADMLQVDARQVFDLQVKLDDQVKDTVTQINSLADQIAQLNQDIKLSASSAQGQTPGALLDQREQAAEKLATLIDANFTITGDGSMAVSFSGGVLANGDQSWHLAETSSLTDPGRTGIGYFQTGQGQPTDVTKQIKGGQLGGLLTARDGDVESARLSLNSIAYGLITRSNEVNETYTATDLTTSHDIFVGSSAADIAIDPITSATPDYIGGTRDALAPGDLANMQGQIQNFIQFSSMRTAKFGSIAPGLIDPTQSIQSQVFTVSPTASTVPGSGVMVISGAGIAIPPITWDTTMSINDIIREINSSPGKAIYATFDATQQKIIIVGQGPLSVYDVSGNLADMLMISASVTSSAPINNYPVPGTSAGLQVDNVGAMNNVQNTLDLFTTVSSKGGTILIDGVPMTWVPTDQISGTLFFNVQGNNAPPGQINLFWDPTTQTVQLEKSGDPFGANAGSHSWPANSMTSIQVVDKTGNLTRVLNLDTDTNSSKILDQLVVSLGSRVSEETALNTQAQALVNQTQQLQANESQVDLNQEQAQAKLYARSYEASVRLQEIMDEMLNVLINHTGALASSSGAI